jgi:hypothetical protein
VPVLLVVLGRSLAEPALLAEHLPRDPLSTEGIGGSFYIVLPGFPRKVVRIWTLLQKTSDLNIAN